MSIEKNFEGVPPLLFSQDRQEDPDYQDQDVIADLMFESEALRIIKAGNEVLLRYHIRDANELMNRPLQTIDSVREELGSILQENQE